MHSQNPLLCLAGVHLSRSGWLHSATQLPWGSVLGLSFLGLAWEEPLQEVPAAAGVPFPQKSRLKCSRSLRTWTMSWLCPSIYFLMAWKTMTNVMPPLCFCGCLSRPVWAGLEWMPLSQGSRLNEGVWRPPVWTYRPLPLSLSLCPGWCSPCLMPLFEHSWLKTGARADAGTHLMMAVSFPILTLGAGKCYIKF